MEKERLKKIIEDILTKWEEDLRNLRTLNFLEKDVFETCIQYVHDIKTKYDAEIKQIDKTENEITIKKDKFDTLINNLQKLREENTVYHNLYSFNLEEAKKQKAAEILLSLYELFKARKTITFDDVYFLYLRENISV